MPELKQLQNRQWRVARYPNAGESVSRTLFEWARSPLPDPAAGEFLVQTLWLALGPAQRGYLKQQHSGDFLASVPIGEVMRGRGVGQIVASRNTDYPVGQFFVGSLGWQDYSVQQPRGQEFVFSTRLVSDPLYPLSSELTVTGQAGVTAYFGLYEAAKLQRGDKVLVSAAAGGVGSAAGQIARLSGAGKVVGLTGSDEKCAWLTDTLGYDAAINYKTADLDARLNELFPAGLDVFFDNVGGAILNTALDHLAANARIAVAGFIATDYDPDARCGPINYRNLVSKRARMQGFVFFDYWERYGEAEAALRDWHRSGQLNSAEHVTEGLENMPDALAGLFSGANTGVAVCRVNPDPPH